MKLLLFISLMIIFINAFAQNKDIEELTRLNQDWINSHIRKGTATLNTIFADVFILIFPKGGRMTRNDIINI